MCILGGELRFRVLGPLEVDDDDRQIVLGGIRQRATLGFLLLQPNRVVATSRLLKALWGADTPPSSARKILQNAVWSLRQGVLTGKTAESGRSAALLTQEPGYVLRVDPDQVDLHRFTAQVENGRSLLASGSPEEAAAVLREALALWRGPALADLVENGINWPELTVVQNARLDATEDRFEAELACGRHQAVLRDLEMLVEAEPLRERLCGQLMLALYRSGRQVDALHVYARVRSVMVDQVGLEPGGALQKLQHSILNHEPELASPAAPKRAVTLTAGAHRANGAGVRLAEKTEVAYTEVVPRPAAPVEVARATAPVEVARVAAPVEVARPAAPVEVVPQPQPDASGRCHVSVLLVRVALAPDGDDFSPAEVDRALGNATAAIREEIAAFDGEVAAAIGSLSLAVFGVPQRREDDAVRAVRAAMRIRDRLGSTGGHGPRLAIQIAVSTGDAMVCPEPGRDDSVGTITGGLLGVCEYLLFATQSGSIRVCDETRRDAASAIAFGRAEDEQGWLVTGERSDRTPAPTESVVAQECELQALFGLLEWVRDRKKPHLVTVLGEAGVGKTRLVEEFRHRFSTQPEVVRFLATTTPPIAKDPVAAVQAGLISSYCGIRSDDSTATARLKLAKTISRLRLSDDERACLLDRFGALLDRDAPPVADPNTWAAWWVFLKAISVRHAFVLVIDDLHRAGDALLDFVEELANPSWSLPLLVIAVARPELPQRRPSWGGGDRHGLTITLDAVSDATIDELLNSLVTDLDGAPRDIVNGLFSALPAKLRQEPTVHRRYVRWLLAPACRSGCDCCEQESSEPSSLPTRG